MQNSPIHERDGSISLIPPHETLSVEFKSDVGKMPYPDQRIYEAVVGLANAEGGTSYLGVENNSEVTGLHPDRKNPVAVSAKIADSTYPPLAVRIDMLEVGESVLRIDVPRAQPGRIYSTSSGKFMCRRLKSNGEPETVPRRLEQILERDRMPRAIDPTAELLPTCSISDLSRSEIDRMRKMVTSYGGEAHLTELDDDVDLLEELGLVKMDMGQPVPTRAAILLLGEP